MSQQAMQQALDALRAAKTVMTKGWALGITTVVDRADIEDAIATLEKELALHTAGAAGPIGMPLAWIYEDELPDSYPYDKMFPHSEVRSGVRMFPVFGPPAIEVYRNAAEDAEMPWHWTSADGQQHWVTTDHALEILRWFYDEWPGGV